MKKKIPASPSVDPALMTLFQMEPRKSDLKRLRIVEACLLNLAENGISGMSLDAVGMAVGMSRSQLLYYYPDKDALLESVIRLITATAQSFVVQKVAPLADAEARLRALIQANLDWAETHPNHAKVMGLFFHFCTVSAKYRALHTQIRKSGSDRLAALIEAVRAGKAATLPPAVAANAIQALLTGLLIERFTTDFPRSPPSRQDWVIPLVFSMTLY